MQSPSWEANTSSGSQEIPRILWNSKVVHYPIHKSPPPVPTLSQINPVHPHPTSWRSIYYRPIYAWVFQMVSFLQVSPPKSCMHLSFPHTCYMLRPFIILNLITWKIMWKNQLDAQLNLVYFVNLNMFRAYLGPSSGGTTDCVQHLVIIILSRWLAVLLELGIPNTHLILTEKIF
jgi:hypothetical protein